MITTGIPDYLKVYKALTPDVVVAIFEQGHPPHPNNLDRLVLYVRVEQTFVKMGMKINITSDLDLKRWVQQSLQKRIDTRSAAIERLRREAAEQETELSALEAALRDTNP